jgi:hypothetical protein
VYAQLIGGAIIPATIASPVFLDPKNERQREEAV